MKAQFATLEALAALFMALSTASAVANIIHNYQINYTSDRYNLSIAAAASDFMAQISSNALARGCILSGNESCINGYASEYRQIYGISNLSIIRNKTTGLYINTYCSEIPGQELVCIGVK